MWRALRREGGAAGTDFARGGGRDRRVRVAPSVVWMVPPVTKGVNACAGSSGRLESRSFARTDVSTRRNAIPASIKRRSFVKSLSAPKPCGVDDDTAIVEYVPLLYIAVTLGDWRMDIRLHAEITRGSP